MSEKNNKVSSPCISVCSMEIKSGHCYGCGRSREEIGQWQEMSEEKRNAIILELPKRLEKIPRPPRKVTKRAKMRNKATT